MMSTNNETQSIDSKILASIRGRGRGSVFLPADFLDLGSREAVDIALHRLARKGTIRRIARGVYDFPKEHPVLGPLQPSAEAVARALAGRDRTRLQPAGAYAANALGLSEQVPATVVFLTDGPSRTVKIGSSTIQLRRTTAKNMAAAGRLSGLLIQALRELGKEHVTPERLAHLKRTLPAKKRQELIKDIRLAPAWMHPIFRELAEEDA
jgi:predicted transcriptional regulator of viral defense system